MPFEIEVDVQNRIVRVRLFGRVTGEDLVAGDDHLRAHVGFQPDFDQLVDTDGALGIDIPNESIVVLAGRPPLFGQVSRRAIVARTDLGWGMARMFELRRGGDAGEIRVFGERGEAVAWLEGKRTVRGKST